MFHPRSKRLPVGCALLLTTFLMAGCGGGDETPAASAGLWEGTRDGSRVVRAIVLGDGTYYLKYAGSGDTPGGLIRGTGFEGGGFSSTDGIDFHFAFPPQLPTPASISSTPGWPYAVHGAVNGAPLELAPTEGFDLDDQLADLAGSYPGDVTFSLGTRQTVFDVTADGRLSTSLNGCDITGQVTARGDDTFDLTIRFGGAPCVFPGAAFDGAVVYSHSLGRLEAAVVNPALGQAIAFTATKNPQ